MGDTEFDPWDLQPTNVATGEPTADFAVPYSAPTFLEVPDTPARSDTYTAPTPATNGARDGSDTSFSFGQFGSTLKAGADSLLGVYKDWTQFQLAGQQLQATQQNAKLNYQVTSTQNEAAAAIAKAQASKDIAVAKAQAEQAINSAQMRAANSKGDVVLTLPSQKIATYAAILGVAFAAYSALKGAK